MPKRISVEGKTYVVPDDATDEEINQIVGPARGPKLTEKGQEVPEGGFGMGHYLKQSIPSGSDLLHGLGMPANEEEAEKANQETVAHPVRSFFRSPVGSLMYGGPAVDAAIGMGREGARGARGMVEGDPYAGLHMASAMDPFAAPVVDAMSRQGLGTREANATGIVNAVPMAVGLGGKAVRPYVGEGVARTGGFLTRNAEPIGNTMGYGGAALATGEELFHGRPVSAGATALMSPLAANRAIRLTRATGEGLLGLGNKVGRIPRPMEGPAPRPEGFRSTPFSDSGAPTARMVDVPSWFVQSSPQAPVNLLDQTRMGAPQASGEFDVVPSERGTWSADPRTHEEILEDLQNRRGEGQGKVALRGTTETAPAAPAPRSSRPGFGTAPENIPIEERMDMTGYYGKTPTRHNVDASNIFTPRAMEGTRFVPKEEMTPEDLAFQDQNMEDILAASIGQRRLQSELPRTPKRK